MTLADQIMDATEQLAKDNALWVGLVDIDILHRTAQMVEEEALDLPYYRELTIRSYRHSEKEVWKAHDQAAALEELYQHSAA